MRKLENFDWNIARGGKFSYPAFDRHLARPHGDTTMSCGQTTLTKAATRLALFKNVFANGNREGTERLIRDGFPWSGNFQAKGS